MTEPCPFCKARIAPIPVVVGVKRCPACLGEWTESGGGIPGSVQTPPGGGGEVAAAC